MTTPKANEIPIHCAYDRLVPIAKLKPHPSNPNRHPKAQLDIFRKVVETLGWRAPIVVSARSGLIIKGHARWNGDRDKTTLWKIVDSDEHSTLWDIPSGDQDADTMHSTQKPLECMRRPILNNSLKGDAVYEPFNGSGTTLIACEQLERRCFAVELNPLYVAVAIERWHKLTGNTPELC